MEEDNIHDFNRPQMFLFGCSLKADKKEFKVELDDDEADHQLSLKAVCLGAEAEDQFHTVEMEGTTYDGKTIKIPLAVLKPSVLPSMSLLKYFSKKRKMPDVDDEDSQLSLGGFEVTPPVSFRLRSGGGPVYISGQHFVSMKESDDEEEEENNSSPVKRPSNMVLKKAPLQKKLKMESDDDDEDDDDEDDSEEDDDEDDDEEDDEDDEEEKTTQKSSVKPPTKVTGEKNPKSADKQNGSSGKKEAPAGKIQTKTPVEGKNKSGAGPSGKTPSLTEIKSRLAAAAKEGKALPKTEQKFENYAKSSWKITDKEVVKDLWNYLQTLKKEKK